MVLMDEYDEEPTYIYLRKDIETLRQKLIEDFIGFTDYIVEKPSDALNATKRHIEIINKRFGVNK